MRWAAVMSKPTARTFASRNKETIQRHPGDVVRVFAGTGILVTSPWPPPTESAGWNKTPSGWSTTSRARCRRR
jgi:hypothetical protein